MASIELTESALATVKKALRDDLPDVRSSHLTEALAAALRRRTHAALLAELPALRDDPPIELLDDERFDQRLQELGYQPEPEFSFELLNDAGVFSTLDPNAWEIDYKTAREKAWRNLMVSAINAGLEQKLFSLRLNDTVTTNSSTVSRMTSATTQRGQRCARPSSNTTTTSMATRNCHHRGWCSRCCPSVRCRKPSRV